MMLPLPHSSKDRRELLAALTDTLTRIPELRNLWVALLLTLNPRLEVPAKYTTSWTWHLLQNTLPLHDPLGRLEAFKRWFIQDDPRWTPVFGSAEGALWLMEVAERCAQGRYRDPCRPLEPQKRLPYVRTVEEWRALMLPLIEEMDRPGDPVTKARLVPYLKAHLPQRSAKQMMRTDDAVEKFISRQGKRFGCTWDDLVAEVRARRSA